MAVLDRNGFLLSGALAYISFSVHPFIYAARYEVFRRYLKQMRTKTNVVVVAPNNANDAAHHR